jgi:acetyl-CoA synthetase (ADP-forming)
VQPKAIFKKVKREKRNVLTLEESIEILKYYKIPVAKTGLAKTIEEAVLIAKKIGYPVVLKIVSPQLIHKTEAKGAILDIKNKEELKKMYEQLLRNVKRFNPSAKIHGVIVQEMIREGYETIVGGIRDAQFGPTVMLGLGGIFTEVYNDTSFRVAPLSKKDALEMIKEIKGYEILKGYRNNPPADINALIDVLIKVGKIMSKEDEIKEIDINPLFLSAKRSIAVDARIILQ